MNLNQLNAFSASNPCAQNYVDVMGTESESYLADYKLFVGERYLAGLSPEGNFNIYGHELQDLEQALGLLLNEKGGWPDLIIGDNRLHPLIEKSQQKVTRYNPYYSMRLENPTSDNPTTTRQVVAGDQEIINFWYENFNRDENSSWSTPNVAELAGSKLYLLEDSGEFLGGCANTLVNESRLWIGRLYILPHLRRKGHGHDIMGHIENTASAAGQSVDLLVNIANESAVSFYKKRGYQILSENAFWCLEGSERIPG
ncbi:MAG: GNAT family N-acetyltransferase [Halobacteriovoraceae bacterium]|jgi:ribosomal protein S18 acetylase RimI-like enzyme|nr:GNAT family N-acetyltransferase [Halobacteriovoraceae bacterium]